MWFSSLGKGRISSVLGRSSCVVGRSQLWHGDSSYVGPSILGCTSLVFQHSSSVVELSMCVACMVAQKLGMVGLKWSTTASRARYLCIGAKKLNIGAQSVLEHGSSTVWHITFVQCSVAQ